MPSRSSALGPSIGSSSQARLRVGADRRVVWQRLGRGEARRRGELSMRPARSRPSRLLAPYSAQSSHHHAGCPPSWYSTSTPGRRTGLDPGPVERRLLAGDAGEQLGPLGDLRERGGERLGRVAPGHQLAAGVAERVAGGEAALGVVACGRGDARPGAAPLRPCGRPPRWRRSPGRGRRRAARRAPPAARSSGPRGPASRTAPRHARTRGSRWGCWAAPAPRRPGAAWMPASSS